MEFMKAPMAGRALQHDPDGSSSQKAALLFETMLDDGERLLWADKAGAGLLVARTIAQILIFAVKALLWAALAVAAFYFLERYWRAVAILPAWSALGNVFGILVYVLRIPLAFTTHYAITDRRVMIQRGMLIKSTESLVSADLHRLTRIDYGHGRGSALFVTGNSQAGRWPHMRIDDNSGLFGVSDVVRAFEALSRLGGESRLDSGAIGKSDKTGGRSFGIRDRFKKNRSA